MIATARPDLWVRAAEIRQEWLEIGLSVAPVDRPATEKAIASIYAACRRDRPEFVWVPSPAAALPHLADLPTHRSLLASVGRPRPSAASDIAAGLSRLRSAVMETYVEPPPDRAPMKRAKGQPWPVLRPEQALAGGLPFHEMLRQGVGEALSRTLADGIHNPLRSLLATMLPAGFLVPALSARDHLPVGWYGNQDAAWLGHLEVLRRLRLVSLGSSPGLDDAFANWVALARSGGWWWPGERHCVVVERPTVIRTEPVPGAWHGELRFRHAPVAVEYRDGWFR